jgi:hypothetical protein
MGKVLDRIAGRYFIYRSLYVAHFREHAPGRLGWALASEIARLGFTLFCALLCALVFVTLTLEAANLPSKRGWALPFGLLAAFALWAAAKTGGGLADAAGATRTYRRELLKK